MTRGILSYITSGLPWMTRRHWQAGGRRACGRWVGEGGCNLASRSIELRTLPHKYTFIYIYIDMYVHTEY